jgi:hypothetical protein
MTTRALLRLLLDAARETDMAAHTYVVGGAPRDCLLGHPVKDLDVVVEDPGGSGRAGILAQCLAGKVGVRHVAADQYGVVHVGPFPASAVYEGVNLAGEKVEIVTARAEKYDKSLKTGSHKPVAVRPGTLAEDLSRRDFRFNTLAWRLADIPEGRFAFADIPIVDTLDGRADLRAGLIRTPLDARVTFEEDPSRMLRAIRFSARFDFQYDPDVEAALGSMADEMRRLPYELLDGVLCGKILTLPYEKMQRALLDLERFGLLKVCLERIPEARLRRVVDGVVEVRKFLLLIRHGFPSYTRGQLDSTHFDWLHQAEVRETDERLQMALDRFVKPPIDVEKLMTDKGLVGPAIRNAVTLARRMLLPDPFVDGAELHQRVAAALP